MSALLQAKRARWAQLRAASAETAQLDRQQDLELTYTSNAIEGNTLTARETAEAIEHGITIAAKPLKDYLEAVDHHAAIQWVRSIAAGGAPLTETIVTELHRRIIARSQPEIAGVYSRLPRRIVGSGVVFPAPAKIPDLMEAFGAWLTAAPDGVETAFAAHLRLVSIHPFADGNGRTARLLMNLILLRAGFPPMPVGPEHRAAYIDAVETAQLSEDASFYDAFMVRRLDETLDAAIIAAGG